MTRRSFSLTRPIDVGARTTSFRRAPTFAMHGTIDDRRAPMSIVRVAMNVTRGAMNVTHGDQSVTRREMNVGRPETFAIARPMNDRRVPTSIVRGQKCVVQVRAGSGRVATSFGRVEMSFVRVKECFGRVPTSIVRARRFDGRGEASFVRREMNVVRGRVSSRARVGASVCAETSVVGVGSCFSRRLTSRSGSRGCAEGANRVLAMASSGSIGSMAVGPRSRAGRDFSRREDARHRSFG
jgi:hypothetical protein